jgi:hypothetical protein
MVQMHLQISLLFANTSNCDDATTARHACTAAQQTASDTQLAAASASQFPAHFEFYMAA